MKETPKNKKIISNQMVCTTMVVSSIQATSMSSVKTRDTLNRSSPPSDLRSSLRAILRDSAPKLARKEDRGEGVVGDVGNEGAVAMLMTILSAQSATILC